MRRRLVIRADADATMGAGHIMRMIALAQAWRDEGGDVLFLSRITADSLKERILSEGCLLDEPAGVYPESGDLGTLLELTTNDDLIAIDGYRFDSQYMADVQAAGRYTLVMDDVNDRGLYSASILLNQNEGGAEYDYSTAPGTHLLCGAEYALLRKEFLDHTPRTAEVAEEATNILVTFGAGDSGNLTAEALRGLEATGRKGLHVKAVVGALNPHMEMLTELAESLSFQCDLLAQGDMPALMDWADLAIGAAGSTCWELCYFGVPMILRVVAENQRGIAANLARQGAALVVGDFASTVFMGVIDDAAMRTEMSRAGQSLVDGQGARRIARLKRVLFLGYGEDEHELIAELRNAGCIVEHAVDRIDSVEGYDLVVSYGYRFIIPESLISRGAPIVNLHISYLPYNRGAHPNFWSFYDNTPKGVTIHMIDEGVDTGPIVAQREVAFDEETTFMDTYTRLRREIESLFVETIPVLLSGDYTPVPQEGEGTYHSLKDLPEFSGGWESNIQAVMAELSETNEVGASSV